MAYVGIDPGIVNLGFCIIDNGIIHTETLNPREMGITNMVTYVREKVSQASFDNGLAVLERFVAYQGKLTSDSENILMVIGGLAFVLEDGGYDVRLLKAIDWKISLCKYLVKNHGFSNPSSTLDKKFSVAAAGAIFSILNISAGVKMANDHEADAVCLAFYGKLISEGMIK